jgi:hypothetical protein
VGSASSVSFRYMGNALVGGEIVNGRLCRFVFDGTFAVILNHGGGWATWTPTGSGAFPTSLTVNQAQYQRHGSRVDIRGDVQATTTSTNGLCGVSLPINAASNSGTIAGSVFDGAIKGGYALFDTTRVTVYKYDSASFSSGIVTVARFSGSYAV